MKGKKGIYVTDEVIEELKRMGEKLQILSEEDRKKLLSDTDWEIRKTDNFCEMKRVRCDMGPEYYGDTAPCEGCDRFEEIIPRDSVKKFAIFMEEILGENENKGGWKDCSDNYLIARAMQEMGEFLIEQDCYKKKKEAIDVANLLMMFVDNNSVQ